MPVRVPVGSSDYPSVMDLLQLPTFCSCNNLHDRSATFCISVLQKTSLNGMWRETPLKTPREIADVEVFLEKSFITHIRSYKDPVVEMTRPEQTMTVYRSDGSYVEIFYSRGEVTYRDSRKKGQTCMMTADTFLDWVVH